MTSWVERLFSLEGLGAGEYMVAVKGPGGDDDLLERVVVPAGQAVWQGIFSRTQPMSRGSLE